MASLHRVHVGPMAGDVHQKLGNIPDIDHCWRVIREHIGRMMFGESYVTVPMFTLAEYFTQLSVFTRKRSFSDVLFQRPASFLVIGNMDYMLDRNRSTWFPQFDISPWDIADSNSMYNDYRFRLTPNPKKRTIKIVELVVKQPRARFVSIPDTDSIVLKRESFPGLGFKSYIYVINRVVFASNMHLLVRIGQKQKFLRYDRDVPIAFSYVKYRLHADGTLGHQLSTNLKYNDLQVTWLRPQCPPMPKFEPKELTVRKHRTALTVSNQDVEVQHSQATSTGTQTAAQPENDQQPQQMITNQPAVYEVRNIGGRVSYVYRPRMYQLQLDQWMHQQQPRQEE